MNNIEDKKNILSQIVKARDAFKKKYKLLQSNKTGVEKAMGEMFKPITMPLEKLVNINEKQQKSLNHESENNEDGTSNFSVDTSFNTASNASSEEEIKDCSSLYEKYSNLSPRLRDNVYGVRKEKDGLFKIGHAPITFTNRYIIIRNVKYEITDDFLELLFESQPIPGLVILDDVNNYRKIVETTNAFRKDYSDENPVHRSKSNKYKYYIAPFFDKSLDKRKTEGTGVSLPPYKLAEKSTHMDYIYSDDRNELVDRLRLVIAELSAGNQSHTNEIHSIIKELRETGYIDENERG